MFFFQRDFVATKYGKELSFDKQWDDKHLSANKIIRRIEKLFHKCVDEFTALLPNFFFFASADLPFWQYFFDWIYFWHKYYFVIFSSTHLKIYVKKRRNLCTRPKTATSPFWNFYLIKKNYFEFAKSINHCRDFSECIFQSKMKKERKKNNNEIS